MFRKYRTNKAVILSAMLLALTACSPKQQEPTTTQIESSVVELNALYDEYFAAAIELEPLRATALGEHQYNDLLPDTLSAEHRERKRMLEDEYLKSVKRFDVEVLPEQAQLSYHIFVRDREMAIEALEHPSHLMPLNQFYNIANQLAMLGSGTSTQPFNTRHDYEMWAERMRAIPKVLDGVIRNMREGMEQDITQPRVLMERTLDQINAHLVDDVTDSLFFQPINNVPESFSEQDTLEISQLYSDIITEEVLPAYQQLRDFVESEYLAAARTDSYGLGGVPGGKDWYAYNVRWRTTTDLTPDEIHNIGLNEVARIHEEIKLVMNDVGFTGTLHEFFEFTRDDPQFHYSSREEMLSDYRAFAAEVEKRSEQLFFADMLPKAGYEIRKVEEFRERSASSGSYSVPSEDGSRPGVFYLNTYNLPARPTWAKAALTLHEAIPGHHYQLALQREMENLPSFRRFGGETAFIEGWGLYTEALGDELGVYTPYDRYGAYVAELWRSIRLVVDTGIHSKGWSRQQVLDYMYANAPVAEARAVSEAERFMALPGQALAYKIGQLKIQELRAYVEQELGEEFDVREFHRQVLRHGALPLSVLEVQIEQWAAQQQ
ncbi:DUF885 domain-containing protein [Aliidiomarina shirensis]|uniref:DUF885 domain-containing protein n=1 Tax=Aliidiomarina shirensis TaxID=1048642 RepID=A0A432WWT6_9GAMM|nr:DUF885 domain-containing protein [Aliidiomarina shirensis]RUO38250.1 DUF885 domain-containing protein [Aliidiomarina shirensis]